MHHLRHIDDVAFRNTGNDLNIDIDDIAALNRRNRYSNRIRRFAYDDGCVTFIPGSKSSGGSSICTVTG